MDETELTARSREIAKEYQLEMPIMNLSYMKFYKQPVNSVCWRWLPELQFWSSSEGML